MAWCLEDALTTHEVATESAAISTRLRVAGVGVHIYTAAGSVLALAIVIAAIDGQVERALWLGLAALVIDGSDGMLARKLRVSETIPVFDGARLDDIVDYLTYAFAPMVLLWTGNFVPHSLLGIALVGLPLLASCYQFCRTDAKTSDHFFLGFPSYWNVIVFYVVVLQLGHAATMAILAFCAVMVFVPIRYLYPSRTKAFRTLNIALTAVWFATYAILVATLPDPSWIVVALSLSYIAYYAGVSLYFTLVLPRLPAKRLHPDQIKAQLDDE